MSNLICRLQTNYIMQTNVPTKILVCQRVLKNRRFWHA